MFLMFLISNSSGKLKSAQSDGGALGTCTLLSLLLMTAPSSINNDTTLSTFTSSWLPLCFSRAARAASRLERREPGCLFFRRIQWLQMRCRSWGWIFVAPSMWTKASGGIFTIFSFGQSIWSDRCNRSDNWKSFAPTGQYVVTG